jgi:hypothetical protein
MGPQERVKGMTPAFIRQLVAALAAVHAANQLHVFCTVCCAGKQAASSDGQSVRDNRHNCCCFYVSNHIAQCMKPVSILHCMCCAGLVTMLTAAGQQLHGTAGSNCSAAAAADDDDSDAPSSSPVMQGCICWGPEPAAVRVPAQRPAHTGRTQVQEHRRDLVCMAAKMC